MAPLLQFHDVDFTFPGETPHRVFSRMNLDLEEGCFLTILGSSGCGKSTLLRLAASMLFPQDGAVIFRNGRPNRPDRQRIMIFQSQEQLFPWLTLEENIAFPLKMAGEKGYGKRVAELLDLVQLSRWKNSYPHQLSGGMKQRAALARALSSRPALLLMDEPFASLDAQTRLHLQDWLRDLRKRELGDELAVMSASGDIVSRIPNPLEEPRTPENSRYPDLYRKVFHQLR
jgi:NitT/TauT family transport system ATP-binding protein